MTKKSKDKSKLPQISSSEFRELHFKEQLSIVRLYFTDRTTYDDLCGLPPKELEYLNRVVAVIGSHSDKLEIDEISPLSFVPDPWCLYACRYDPSKYEDDPTEYLGIKSVKVSGVFYLFTFPLLVIDSAANRLLRWVLSRDDLSYCATDTFFYLVRLRAAWEYLRNDEEKEEDIWNLAVTGLRGFTMTRLLNGEYPISEDTELLELIDSEQLVPAFRQRKFYQGRMLIPLVPGDLFTESRFKVHCWDTL